MKSVSRSSIAVIDQYAESPSLSLLEKHAGFANKLDE